MMRENNLSSRIFDGLNVVFLILLSCITIYPFIYVFSCSISDPVSVESNLVRFLPKGFDLQAYKTILNDKYIWEGYYNTIIITAGGTLIGVLLTFMTAYPLSKRKFLFGAFFMMAITFTMFFKGGMIPEYLVANALGLVDTRWALILVRVLGAWHVILVRTFLKSIPEALEESALIDGANDVQVLFRIVLPLSTPILATIALFIAVNQWNAFMPAMIYIRDKAKQPLQVVLYKLVILSQTKDAANDPSIDILDRTAVATIKHAVIIVATIPIILAYPFAQRYFVKGIMIGAIKG